MSKVVVSVRGVPKTISATNARTSFMGSAERFAERIAHVVAPVVAIELHVVDDDSPRTYAYCLVETRPPQEMVLLFAENGKWIPIDEFGGHATGDRFHLRGCLVERGTFSLASLVGADDEDYDEDEDDEDEYPHRRSVSRKQRRNEA